jgi:hypothetical protein
LILLFSSVVSGAPPATVSAYYSTLYAFIHVLRENGFPGSLHSTLLHSSLLLSSCVWDTASQRR